MFDLIVWDTVGTAISPTLINRAMGGSEFGMVLIVEELAKRYRRKCLVLSHHGDQNVRVSNEVGPQYLNANSDKYDTQTLLIHRFSTIPDQIKAERTVLLMTDMGNGGGYEHLTPLVEQGARVLFVSAWQATTFPVVWRKNGIVLAPPRPDSVYTDPIPEKNPRKYIYASAPMKGWDETLAAWWSIKRNHPEVADAQLHACFPWGEVPPDPDPGRKDVVMLGQLSPADMVKEIASSAGLFFVNRFPETFCGTAAIAEAKGCHIHIWPIAEPGAIPGTLVAPIAHSFAEFEKGFLENYGKKKDGHSYHDYSMSELIPKYDTALFGNDSLSKLKTKSTICLNMIVKNEGKVIGRALESAKGLIDSWMILVDPETTDNTREVIREKLGHLPGSIVELPWRGFGETRNDLIKATATMADYILTLDADDEYDGQLPDLLTADAYEFPIHDGGTLYTRPLMFRTNRGFYYVGVGHEILASNQTTQCIRLDTMRYIRGGGGSRSFDPKKFEKDAHVFEHALEDEGLDTGLRSRYLYYLGQSWQDAGNMSKAIDAYQQRMAVNGYVEETFMAAFKSAVCREVRGDDTNIVVGAYLKAFEMRPTRAEPLVELARFLRQKNSFARAYIYASAAEHIPIPDDKLFLDVAAYSWKAKNEKAIAAWYIEKYDEAFELNCNLMKLNLPEPYGSHVRSNYELCCKKLNKSAEAPMAADKGSFTSTNSIAFGSMFDALREALEGGGSEFGLALSLFSLVVSTQSKKIVEIGRYRGLSTMALSFGLKFMREENWQEPAGAKQRPDVDYPMLESRNEMKLVSIDCHPEPIARQRIEENGLSEYVAFVDRRSGEVEMNGTIDLLFIDGDHSYEGCVADFDRFLPHLKDGGYAIAHDWYGWYSNGVNGSPVKKACEAIALRYGMQHVIIDTGYMSFIVFKKTAPITKRPTLSDTDAKYKLFRDRLAAIRYETVLQPIVANPHWSSRCQQMLRDAEAQSPENFLRWESTADFNMPEFTPLFKTWYDELKSKNWSRWEKLTRNAKHGCPKDFSADPGTSPSLLQTAYHLKTFEDWTGTKLTDDIDVLFEVGGGHGGFCKMLRDDGFRGQHIIFDLPHMNALQALFLSLNGIDGVTFEFEHGNVSLINETQLCKTLAAIKGKRTAFVGIWSLSECPLEVRKELFPALHAQCTKYLIATQWYEYAGVNNPAYFESFMREAGNDVSWTARGVPHYDSEYYLCGIRK